MATKTATGTTTIELTRSQFAFFSMAKRTTKAVAFLKELYKKRRDKCLESLGFDLSNPGLKGQSFSLVFGEKKIGSISIQTRTNIHVPSLVTRLSECYGIPETELQKHVEAATGETTPFAVLK